MDIDKKNLVIVLGLSIAWVILNKIGIGSIAMFIYARVSLIKYLIILVIGVLSIAKTWSIFQKHGMAGFFS